MAFAGKVALVTGAGSGIGRALARSLAACGAIVVVTDVNGAAAESVAREIQASQGRGHARPLDVTDAAAVAALADATVSEHGPIDYLFNNAGIAVAGDTRAITLDDWRRVVDVNLFGVIHGIHAVYPRMAARRSGHIVNVASVAGLSPYPMAIPYTASKHAVVGLSQALRAEAASVGVKVSVACPGMIDTPIWTRSQVRGFDLAKLPAWFRPRMTAETCARAILRGVARNDAIVVITAEARAMWMLHRLSPSLGIRAHRAVVKKLRAI